MSGRWRDIVDPVPSRARDHRLRNGAVLLAIVGLAIYMGLSHNLPLINGKPGSPLRAAFGSVNQVSTQTPVRVDGVDVGIVDGIGPGDDPRRESVVSMRITDDGVTVHDDARAEIRWRTVLGGRVFIDLDPGSPRAPKLGNGVIPVGQTGSQVELDDVLRPYDGGTEQAQRDVLKGAGAGFADPDATKRAVRALPDLDPIGRGLAPYAGTETGDLRKLVASTATTVEALGSSPAGLQTLVTGAHRTLAALNTRRTDLGAFLEDSPPSLDSTLSTVTRVRRTLDHLDPLVTKLRPGARRVASATTAARPALAEATGLLGDLRPVLKDLGPTLTDLRRLSDAGTPIVNGLKPTVNRLNDELLPYLAKVDPDTKIRNYTAIGATFSVLSMAAAEYDNIGYRLHLSTPAANNSVISLYIVQLEATCRRAATTTRERAACPAFARGIAYGQLGRPRTSK